MQANADHFRHCLGLYTRILLIGVVIEGVEFAVEVGAWIARKIRRRIEVSDLRNVNEVFPASEGLSIEQHKEFVMPKWVKFFAFVGLLLVVIGVRGELIFEDKLQGTMRSRPLMKDWQATPKNLPIAQRKLL